MSAGSLPTYLIMGPGWTVHTQSFFCFKGIILIRRGSGMALRELTQKHSIPLLLHGTLQTVKSYLNNQSVCAELSS